MDEKTTLPAVMVIVFSIVNVGLSSYLVYKLRHHSVMFDVYVSSIIISFFMIVDAIIVMCDAEGGGSADGSFLLWFTVIVFLEGMIMVGMILYMVAWWAPDTNLFPPALCTLLFYFCACICLIVIICEYKDN
ncbi:hypothetical protein SNEBB_003422 [Seison nebaliae]|nr:hypothetical protein SNEBB_003422 [Seison nebaliae]